MQASLATHQFDHAAASLEDTCEICVQLDRSDDAVAKHHDPVDPLAIPGAARPTTRPGFEPASIARHFDSRAPPGL